MIGEVDCGDDCRWELAAQLDGNLRGAGADIENGIRFVPDGQEVRRKCAIDRGVIHRVVVARLRRGIHHLGFENAQQHVRTDRQDLSAGGEFGFQHVAARLFLEACHEQFGTKLEIAAAILIPRQDNG